jgi:hypothetical protein
VGGGGRGGGGVSYNQILKEAFLKFFRYAGREGLNFSSGFQDSKLQGKNTKAYLHLQYLLIQLFS